MSSVQSFYGIAIGVLLLGALAAWRAKSVELRVRTVTLLVLLQIVTLSLAVSGDSWQMFCVVLGVLSLIEMAQVTGAQPHLLLLLMGFLVLSGAHAEELTDHWSLCLVGVVSVASWSIAGIGRGRWRQSYFLAWGTCFLAPSLAALIGARALSVDWIVILVLTTQANDMLGLMAGKFFGRRPLLPRISPNKTLEGFLAGGLGVIFAGWVAHLTCPSFQQLPLAHRALLMLVLFLSANAGDLLFSRVKRCLNLKDYGSLLPGHGGALDRADSLLLTAPVLFTYLTLVSRT